MATSLYIGQVMHQRLQQASYQFRYKLLSMRVDVDSVEEDAKQSSLFSYNAWNLYSLYLKDHGARDGSSWRVWCENLLAEYGVSQKPQRIELVCLPRFLGYSFNPLAMWYAYDEADQVIGIIGEVSNTFGQWHHYVLSNHGLPLPEKAKAKARKVFHVSPFLSMDCWYFFTFKKPSDTYQVVINETEQHQPKLNAVQVGRSQVLSNWNLFKAALQLPFNTLWVVISIHWWALKIWLKGGQFHRTPKQLSSVKHSHTRMELC